MSQLIEGWQAVYIWCAVGLVAGFLSYIFCIKVLAIALKSGMVVQPGKRQSHQQATPTGGGLGLIISIVATTICLELMLSLPGFWWKSVLPGVLLLTIVGWRDDRLPVSALFRLLIQLAVSFWLLGFGWWDLSIKGIVLFTVGILAMVWLMNVYNFMDGSNGMAGFQGVFAGLTMAVLFQSDGDYVMALVAVVVAAACAGFLPLNFPRARVFMGDVSSVPLGFIFASLAFYGVQAGSLGLALSILIMSVFLVDATLTLVSRAIRGERWYTAHAQHIYQRLIAQGWSHSRVLAVYQSINVVLVLPAIVLANLYPQYAVMVVGFVLLSLGAGWHIANRRLSMSAEVLVK